MTPHGLRTMKKLHAELPILTVIGESLLKFIFGLHRKSHIRIPSKLPHLVAATFCLQLSISAIAKPDLTCEEAMLPPGAIEIGAKELLFQDCPKITDMDFTGKVYGKKYYSGLWYGKPSDQRFYEQADDGLIIKRGAAVAMVTMNSYRGYFPLLNGNRPFYLEAQVATSSNDPDNFPAIFLMPIEHNLRMEDVYKPDPRDFERWFELDIDEGGFGPGGHHTAISWSGIWPNYKKIQNPNPSSKEALDRTKPNVFGVSYSPKSLTVKWWLNGKKVLEATHPFVPEIARQQRFYLIVAAQSHKNISDYQMKFMGVRAFAGEPLAVPN